MALRIKQRKHSRIWRIVELAGWAGVTVGLVVIIRVVLGCVARANCQAEDLVPFLGGFVALFLGSVLVVGSREADTKVLCSHCGKELRYRDDSACLHCMTLLEETCAEEQAALPARPRPSFQFRLH